MATGDLVVFDEAKAKMLDGDWASTDEFYCSLMTTAVTPTSTTTTPVFGDFTEVAGTTGYSTDGTSLGTLAALVTQSTGVMTFDSTTNPTWPQSTAGSTNAAYALVYNFTDAGKDALCFIDVGNADMSAGDLTITWGSAGLFTIT